MLCMSGGGDLVLMLNSASNGKLVLSQVEGQISHRSPAFLLQCHFICHLKHFLSTPSELTGGLNFGYNDFWTVCPKNSFMIAV